MSNICIQCADVRERQKGKQIDINQWHIVIKENKLKMNMDKMVTMGILRKLHTNPRIKAANTTVKKAGKSIYLGIKKIQKEKSTEISIQSYNSSTMWQMIQELWCRAIPKQFINYILN
jgi:hypothetical protein